MPPHSDILHRQNLYNPNPNRSLLPCVKGFTFETHREFHCAEFCSPNKTDDPWLWGRDDDDEPFFMWNSSMAESNNSMITREYVC